MSDPGSATVTDVRVILPEHWWAIPLRDPVARERSVAALVDRQFAGLDNQPLLKAQARRELLDQAERAEATDARLMALSLQHVGGTAVPASLVVHWLDTGPQTESVLDLQAAFTPPEGQRLACGESLDLARMPSGPVLRRVHETAGHLTGVEPVSSLVADYWVERPDGNGLVQLVFATPLLPLRDAMLGLFDAITGALRWIYAEPRPRPTRSATRVR